MEVFVMHEEKRRNVKRKSMKRKRRNMNTMKSPPRQTLHPQSNITTTPQEAQAYTTSPPPAYSTST